MADLYVAMYAPLVGNHEHWNLQIVVKKPQLPRFPSRSRRRSNDVSTDFDSSPIRESRKRKRSLSPSIGSSSSLHQNQTDEHNRGYQHKTHIELIQVERQHAGGGQILMSTTTTTIYEVLNQHPDFVASVITTTNISPPNDISPPAVDNNAGPSSDALIEAPGQSTASNGKTSPSSRTSRMMEPITPAKQDMLQSPIPSRLPPISSKLAQRPPVRRLIHLTCLNPADLSTVNDIVKQVKVDNETVHWNCQDYVMEILDELEEACVIDLDHDADSDPDADLVETDGEEGRGNNYADEEEGCGDEGVNVKYEEEGLEEERAGPRSRRGGTARRHGSSYYTKQKRQLLKYFGPVI